MLYLASDFHDFSKRAELTSLYVAGLHCQWSLLEVQISWLECTALGSLMQRTWGHKWGTYMYLFSTGEDVMPPSHAPFPRNKVS